MTASASASDAGAFCAALAHTDATNAAAPQALDIQARMISPPSNYKTPAARPSDSPVASISTSKSSRQTSARKYTMEVEDGSDLDSAPSMAPRSDGCRT